MKGTLLILPAMMVGLTGCGATERYWPNLDEQRSRAVVAVGYFERPQLLPGLPCGSSAEEQEVMHCLPAVEAEFVPQQIVFGVLPSHRVKVASGTLGYWFTRSEPKIVLLISDGRRYVADTIEDIALLRSGEYAVPVFDESLGFPPLDFLPCDATALVRPLTFAPPYPSVLLDSLHEEDAEVARTLPGMAVEGELLYTRRGLPVATISRLLKRQSGVAHEYKRGDSDACAPP